MDATDLDADPLRQLSTWLDAARAAGQPMPEAMTIASATSDGVPSARLVVLRGLRRGLVFFTDCESDKGAELAANPRAAAVLHWLVPAHRQVRVAGPVGSGKRRSAGWLLIPRMQLGFAVLRRPDGDGAVEGDADGYQRIEPGWGLQLAVELNSGEAVFAAHSNGHHSPNAELGGLMTDILKHRGERCAHFGRKGRLGRQLGYGIAGHRSLGSAWRRTSISPTRPPCIAAWCVHA